MRRMLIVDDEQDICDCLTQFFAGRGFSVMTVFTGEEALARLAHDAVDVVLLDVLLPGLSGIEVLKRTKTLAPHTQVIMVSAVDQADVQATAHEYGACGYIVKPFDFSESTWSPVLASS